MPLPLLSVCTLPEYGSISAFVKQEALVLIFAQPFFTCLSLASLWFCKSRLIIAG